MRMTKTNTIKLFDGFRIKRHAIVFFFLLPWIVGGGMGCSDDDAGGPRCGNGVAEPGEVCDATDLRGETCVSMGFLGGELACAQDCSELDLSECTSAQCGNGVAEGEEDCDGEDLNTETCEGLGFAGGTLGCNADCTFDVSDCGGGCGNNLVEGNEQCDGTDLGGQDCADLGFAGGQLGCRPNCQYDLNGCTGGCGNNVLEGQEACDGTDLDGQDCTDLGFSGGQLACSPNCQFDTSSCLGAGEGIGGPCVGNMDCASNWCLPEVGAGWPQGYCLAECESDMTCVDPDATCVLADVYYLCLHSCDPSLPDGCREGYDCADIGGGEGVCWPACTADAECTTTQDCDTDPDSQTHGFCLTPEEVCDNSTDDDFDGQTDCGDPDCSPVCPSGEVCDNAIDDDGDSLIDCDDGECVAHVFCTGVACVPRQQVECSSTLNGQSNDASGFSDTVSNWCNDGVGSWTGPEYTYQMEVTENRNVVVRLENLNADLDVIVIQDDGTLGCNPIACHAYSMNVQPDEPEEEVVFEATPGNLYYIAVDGWQGDVSTFDLTVECFAGEVCDSGTDEDGDGLVDCDDPSCFGQAGCTSELNCWDGYDNDEDGDADCIDADCVAAPYCNAQTALVEDFSNWPPSGWAIEDGADDGATWQGCDPQNGCNRVLLGADGPFAVVDSDAAGQGVTLDEGLITPVLDLAAESHVYLEFVHRFSQYTTPDTGDFAYVEVSTDATTWVPVAEFGETALGTEVLNLSAELAGEPQAWIRFRYTDGGLWCWYWALDSVSVWVHH
jgi:hypothetical protein